MTHHGWRTYFEHGANNCLILLDAVYKHRDDPRYYNGQTQEVLSEWSGIPQQRISDMLNEHAGKNSTKEINHYAKFCDVDNRSIGDIIKSFGGSTRSMLEITARIYGFKFVTPKRAGCLIDVYYYSPLPESDFEVATI